MSVISNIMHAAFTPRNLLIGGVGGALALGGLAVASKSTAAHSTDGKVNFFDHLGSYAGIAGLAGGIGLAAAGPLVLKEALGNIARPAGLGVALGAALGLGGYALFARPAIDAVSHHGTKHP